MKTALMANNMPFFEGPLLTVQKLVDSEIQRKILFADGFKAVDMETYELGEYIRQGGGDVMVLRLISDNANESARRDYEESLKTLSGKLSDVLSRLSATLAYDLAQ